VGDDSRKLERITIAEDGKKARTWALASAPGKPDQTMSNFLMAFNQLVPATYESDVDAGTLQLRARLDYYGEGGKRIGWLELYEQPPDTARDPAATAQYFARSELTRMYVGVFDNIASRIVDDINQIYLGRSATAPDHGAAAMEEAGMPAPGGTETETPTPTPGGAVAPAPKPTPPASPAPDPAAAPGDGHGHGAPAAAGHGGH
jgi:hypothetical protein